MAPRFFSRHAGREHFQQAHATGLALGLAVIVFLADLFTPLGVASAVPYSLAILLALNAPWHRFALAFAIFCSILTLADLYVGPGRGTSELWKVLTNRFLAIGMIWITLGLGVLRRSADERRREAEEQTRLHLADLAHLGRLSTAGQLATTLAHELNQPLAAISFQSEIAGTLLRKDGHASPQVLSALSEVTEQAYRAAEILRSLRQLVRKGSSQRSSLDLNDVVREVARLMDPQFQQAGATLKLRLVPLPLVMGDRIQLEQVLLNLLQNSLDALAEARRDQREVLVATGVDERHSILVTVRDTGVGFGTRDPEQLFERFYTSKPTGMGMGLSISRSIVETHQGRLWAQANPDFGASFCFSLPQPPRASSVC